MKNLLVIVLALTIGLPPFAGAQIAHPAEVGIASLTFDRQPTVGDWTVATAWVRNEGDFDSAVTVEFIYGDGRPVTGPDSPGGINHTLTRIVPARDSSAFTMRFSPAADRAGPTEVVARASANNDANAENNTVRVKTFVRSANLTLRFENATSPLMVPHGTSFLRFFVHNGGNTEDTPQVDTTPTGPWEAEILGPLRPIPPGSSGTGIIIVRAATDNASINLTVDVKATSAVGSTVSARATSSTMRVDPDQMTRAHAVRISGISPSVQLFAPDDIERNFTLLNDGETDDVFLVTASLFGTPVGWRVNVTPAALWPANVTLPLPGGDLLIPLRVGESLPLRLGLVRNASTPNATATVVVNASSVNAPYLGAQLDVLRNASTSVTLVDAGPDLAVVNVSIPHPIYEGDTPAFRFDVSNLGRVNASNSTLALSMRNNLRIVANTTLVIPTLGPQRTAQLTWSPSAAGLRGDFVVTARAVLNASQKDRAPQNDEGSTILTIRGPSLVAHAPASLHVVPGSTLRFTGATGGFAVENRGEHSEAVVATLESPHEWFRHRWEVEVPAGAKVALRADFEVPRYPHLREIGGDFDVRLANRSGVSDSAAVTLAFDDIDPAELSLVSPTAPSRVGMPVRLAVRALDATGIIRTEAVTTDPDGQRTLLSLEPATADADVFEAWFTPRVIGEHRFEFRVEDASAGALPSVLTGLRWNVTESTYGGFLPVNFVEGGLISSPTLKFKEDGPGTTRDATVDYGAGLQPFTAPYEVHVAWTEGRHMVRVQAMGFDGTPWTRTWNVSFDATPPTLSAGSVRDTKGGSVELSVVANSAVRATARFETSNGPVEVPLEAGQDSRFSAIVTPPASWRSVTFIGWDDAGNADSTVVASERQDVPLGVAPALLALALAGGVAAAATRRGQRR